MRKIIFLVCIMGFIFSCKTNDSHRFDDTSMFVMIYDYDNVGVASVTIYKDDTAIGESDIQGRYIIEKDSKDDFTLRFEKNEYEIVEVEVSFNPFTVLYIKMGNANQFLRLAENELDAFKYVSALEYVERSLAIQEERIDTKFLQAVIYNKLEDFNRAESILLEIEKVAGKIEYISMFLEKNNTDREARALNDN